MQLWRQQLDGPRPGSSGCPRLIRPHPSKSHGGAGVNTANRFGATALMWAVSRPENVQLLLQRGAHVNARASNGWSALVAATRHGQLASMRMLLACGPQHS